MVFRTVWFCVFFLHFLTEVVFYCVSVAEHIPGETVKQTARPYVLPERQMVLFFFLQCEKHALFY